MQPTPRWDLHAGTVVLNIDHYTLLQQAVLKVKGVPMFYLPILYYPTKKEDRATGFLIPTYGTSSLRGQSLHNAFFWAINRSQDATFLHDWFSKTGQGVGSEYRYNVGTRRRQHPRVSADDQHDTTYTQTRQRRRRRRRRRAATRSAAAPTSCCPFDMRARGQRELLLQHRARRRRSTPTSTTRRATSARSAATSSAPGASTR